MVYLPQEILERVALHADYGTRRSLLIVSRHMQAAVEKLTWNATYELRSSNIDRFLQLYHGHRISLLRKVVFSVEFPELRAKVQEYMEYPDTDDEEDEEEDEGIPCRESKEDLQAKDKLFSRQILELFMAFKTIEDRSISLKNQHLTITLSIKSPVQSVHKSVECDHRRFSSWRLHLLNPETLPSTSVIQTLIIGERPKFQLHLSDTLKFCERPLDMRIVFDLATKLPSLTVLDCQYINERLPFPYADEVNRHHSRPWEGPRRETRHDFLISIPEHPHQALKHFKMSCGEIAQLLHLDQRKQLPDLVSPLSYDPLSSALRVSSQKLISLDLVVCADSGLFWPSPEDPNTNPPSWLHLKHLSALFHQASPSGTWYLEGIKGGGRDDSGYKVTESHYPPLETNDDDERWEGEWGRIDSSEPNMFRTEPNDSNIEPLLEAFAKALGKMPVLEDAELFTYLYFSLADHEQHPVALPTREREDKLSSTYEAVYKWGVKYIGGASARLEWRVGEWRPSKTLVWQFSRAIPEERWVYL